METINTTAQDLESSMTGIRNLLQVVGEDAGREGLVETPARFVKAFQEMTEGYRVDPEIYLTRTFKEKECDEMILVRNIAFASLCEHHLLPFVGIANVAYIPRDGIIVGLSKIPRLVLGYARRLQVQERLTQQIGKAMDKQLHPQGVAVQVIAQHQCMSCRGVMASSANMVTSYISGAFRASADVRAEFYSQLGQK